MSEHHSARIISRERNLNHLYRMIEERRAAGIDTAALEALWMSLLDQYEAMIHERETV